MSRSELQDALLQDGGMQQDGLHMLCFISRGLSSSIHTYIRTPHTSIGREASCEFTEYKIILSLVGLYVRRSHLLLVPSEHLQGRVCMYVCRVCMYVECYLFSDISLCSVRYAHFCQVPLCTHSSCGKCKLFTNSQVGDVYTNQ